MFGKDSGTRQAYRGDGRLPFRVIIDNPPLNLMDPPIVLKFSRPSRPWRTTTSRGGRLQERRRGVLPQPL